MQVGISGERGHDIYLRVNGWLLMWWDYSTNEIIVSTRYISTTLQRAKAALGISDGVLCSNVGEAQAMIILRAYKLKLEEHHADRHRKHMRKLGGYYGD